MAITQLPPGTIWLAGPRTEINDLAASEAITPGHLVERWNNAGVIRLRKHATASGAGVRLVATEQSMINLGVNDVYNINDLVEASEGAGGTSFWMWLAASMTVVATDMLESAGDGTLRKLTTGVPLFKALENKTTTGATARIRVEVV